MLHSERCDEDLVIHKRPLRKAYFVITLLIDFGMLFVFKYLGFACANLNSVFHTSLAVNIALPIGISFYIFQIASYIIDLYRGQVAVQKSLLNLGLYISMFPQLIAGPIVRYETIEQEIEQRHENWDVVILLYNIQDYAFH